MNPRTRWSPSALQTLDGCPRRHALREAGWHPRPNPLRPPAPHAQFGRIWHAGAETFDRAVFFGATRDQATDEAMQYAIEATWDAERGEPWAGQAVDEWRCADGKVPSPVTGKPIKCPGSKGWWIVSGARVECSECGGPVDRRRANIPHHPTKNRTTLLRAVLDYCDEALPGVVAINGARLPGLEVDLEFRLHGHNLHCFLDRYTRLDGGTYLAHERKSSSRYPNWDHYFQTFQVRFYPEALRQNGLRCDGVLIEHYQILNGGTSRSTATLTPGPDHVQEAAEHAARIIALAAEVKDLAPFLHSPCFANCSHAAGGLPCDYLKLCKAAFARRPEILQSEFIQQEKSP